MIVERSNQSHFRICACVWYARTRVASWLLANSIRGNQLGRSSEPACQTLCRSVTCTVVAHLCDVEARNGLPADQKPPVVFSTCNGKLLQGRNKHPINFFIAGSTCSGRGQRSARKQKTLSRRLYVFLLSYTGLLAYKGHQRPLSRTSNSKTIERSPRYQEINNRQSCEFSKLRREHFHEGCPKRLVGTAPFTRCRS